VETWKKLSEARDEFTPERRAILKRIGVLGSAVSISGLGVFAGAGAAQTDTEQFETTTLEPPQSGKILGRLKRTDEFRRLRDHVINELDGKIRFNVANATVVKVSGEDPAGQDRTRYLAYSPIEGTSGDGAYATIGIDAETKEVVVAGTEISNTETITPEEYPIQFDDVEGKAATVRKEIELADATGEKVTTATVTNEDFDRISDLGDSSGGDVSIQSTFPCDICKTAVTGVCIAGCGAPVLFLCGFIGVGTGGIGGFTCGAFIAVVCTLIGVYGCTTTNFDQKICADRRIDLC
jgi:halocin C8-like bacteriocin domain-containing protein